MQIYVKSAGFSVNQDYSWVDQSGCRMSMDLSILANNVEGVTFVWKGTGTKIYIFGNSFVDKSRTDLCNRPLRNYILLEGRLDEADLMYCCFEKMLLDQDGFAKMLIASVHNVSGDSETGFSVDFGKITDYFATQMCTDRQSFRLNRHLYEIDSYGNRKRLLGELLEIKRSSVTMLVGGELSGRRLKELAPDRALLSNIDDIGNQGSLVPDNNKSSERIEKALPGLTAAAAVMGVGVVVVAAGVAAWLIKKMKD